MAQQRRYQKRRQPTVQQIEDQESVAGLESKAQGLRKAIASAVSPMKNFMGQSDLAKSIITATTAQMMQQTTLAKDLTRQASANTVAQKAQVQAAKDIAKETVTTVNNQKTELQLERDKTKEVSNTIKSLREQKQAARSQSVFSKPTTPRPTAPAPTPNITVEVTPPPVQPGTATQETTKTSFISRLTTSLNNWADKMAAKTAARENPQPAVRSVELQQQASTQLEANTNAVLNNQAETNNLASAVQNSSSNINTNTEAVNNLSTVASNAATAGPMNVANQPSPNLRTSAYANEGPTPVQQTTPAESEKTADTQESASSKVLKERLKEELIAAGAITREKAKDEKVVEAILKAGKEYNDDLRYSNSEVEEQIGNYGQIRETLAGVSTTIKDNLKALKTTGDRGDHYKEVLSGALNIQRSLKKSTDDLVYNQSRLAEGELTSAEAQEDSAKVQAQLRAIEFERKNIANQISELQKFIKYTPEQTQLADSIAKKEKERAEQDAKIVQAQEKSKSLAEQQKKVNTSTVEGQDKYRELSTKIAEQDAKAAEEKQKSKNLTAEIAGLGAELVSSATGEQKSIIEQQTALREIDYSLNGAVDAANQLGAAFNKDAEKAAKIEGKLGLVGKLLGGLKKIPVLGDIVDFGAAEKAMKSIAKDGGSTMDVLKGGFKALGPSIKAAFGPLGLVLAVVEGIQALIGMMFEADKQVTDIANQLGVSKDAASDIRDSFFETADGAKELGVVRSNQLLTEKQIFEANQRINEALGTAIDYSQQFGLEGQKSLAAFAAVSKFLRLSEDEQEKLAIQSAMTGKNAKEIESSISKQVVMTRLQTGYQANFKKVMKDVLGTSNLIRTSFKGNTDALVRTVIEAQKMGTTLEKLNSIANTFLDFESSVTSEMESEVLLGRDLNLNMLRGYALRRDAAGVQKELSRLIQENGDAIEGDAIAFESMAKTLGMSTDEFADMYEKQKLSLKLSQAQSDLSDDVVKKLKEVGGLNEGQIAQLKAGKMTGVEFYAALKKSGVALDKVIQGLSEAQIEGLEEQTIQEKYNDALARAKEIFTSFVDGGTLDALANLLTKIVNSLASIYSDTGQAVNEQTVTGYKQQLSGKKGSAQFESEYQAKLAERQGSDFYNVLDELRYDLVNPVSMVAAAFSEKVREEKAQTIRTFQEGKVLEEMGAEAPEGMADGGVVQQSGLAQVDAGEVYLGKNTRETVRVIAQTNQASSKATEDTLAELKKLNSHMEAQNRLLATIGNKELVIEADKLAYTVAKSTVMSYGNVLNPNSRIR